MSLAERRLMNQLLKAKRVLGDRFSRDNYRKLEGYPTEYTYRKRYGSWTKTVRELHKVDPTLEKDPQIQLLMFMHKAKSILGTSFTRDTYRHLKGFPSEYKIVKTFGSWSNAIVAMNNV